jgi:uncharacterized protein
MNQSASLHFIPTADERVVVFEPTTRLLFRCSPLTARVLREVDTGRASRDIANDAGLTEAAVNEVASRVRTAVEEKVRTWKAAGSRDRALGKLTFHVANDCPFKCSYCYAGGGTYGQPSGLMSPELARATLARFFERYESIGSVMFFGGEPLLNLDAIEATCKYCHDRHANGSLRAVPAFGMVSNLFALPNRFIELVLRYRIGVTVSLDGPQAINDSHRRWAHGGGTFDRVSENIRRLRAATGQPTMIEATFNASHVAAGMGSGDLIDYFKDQFGILRAEVADVTVPRGHSARLPDGYATNLVKEQDSIAVTTLEALAKGECVPSLNALHNVLGLLVRNGPPFELHCTAGVEQYAVSVTGELYPCHMLVGRPEFLMGDVACPDVFTDMHHLEMKNRLALNGKRYVDPCHSCWCSSMCLGCIAKHYVENGSISIPEPGRCARFQASVSRMLLKLAEIHETPLRWATLLASLDRMKAHSGEERMAQVETAP